jgi:3-hydroxyacyl-CoA dehydrogenase
MDRRGQKNGRGFYDYDENRQASPSAEVEKAIRDFVARSGKAARDLSDDEILERCVYPMINEGIQILADRKAIRASDIDIIWVNGYGWPAYRGGPMYYGQQIGLDKVLAKLRAFEASHGEAFAPAPLLVQMVEEGKSYRDLGY